MAGLRPEQGPPLGIPMSFFLSAPLALAGGAVLLLASPAESLESIWAGSAIALVHLTTLGFLMTVMLGALYQLLPVVAGAGVPAVRLAHAVHALLLAGTAVLVWAVLAHQPIGFVPAIALLGAALVLFALPGSIPLFSSRVRHPTVSGMRVAFLGLAAVAILGFRLAWGRAGAGYAETWIGWRNAHAHLGFLVWVGGLTTAVSWQVVPMFYLAAPPPAWVPRAVRWAISTTLVALLAVFILDLPDRWVPLAALPGAAAVWLAHPLAMRWSLRTRRRRRPDPTLLYWGLAMAMGPVVFCLGVAASLSEAPMLPALYGFAALWGWAGSLVLGMLARIVPFLVWLHRCSRRVGLEPVPSSRELLPDRHVTRTLWLHAATLVLGAAAIVLQQGWLWRLFGAALGVEAVHLAAGLALVLWRAPAMETDPPRGTRAARGEPF